MSATSAWFSGTGHLRGYLLKEQVEEDQRPYDGAVDIASLMLEYMKTLIWPAVFAGVLIGYRRFAYRLLDKRTKVNLTGVTATFDNAAREAEAISSAGAYPQKDPTVRLREAVRITPTTYELAAREIGEQFRDGKPVLLDLTEMRDDEAMRLVDFSAGLAFMSGSWVDRVTSRVLMLTPSSK